LADRQGYVTWQQITGIVPASRTDPDAALAILDALERRGIVLVEDPQDSELVKYSSCAAADRVFP
jgi:hypothetical protein